MLTRTSTQLLTTLHPVYEMFNTRFVIKVNPEGTMFSNVPYLSNELIYELAEKDVKTEGSILVMKQRKYQNYVNWFSKTMKETLNLRLSQHKLDTRLMTEQYILLLKRYHPFIEDLNRFILIVEVIYTKFNDIVSY